MSGAGARVGVGTRFRYDGETAEVVEMTATAAGNELVLKDERGRYLRVGLKELLFSDRAVIIPEADGPGSDDEEEITGVALGQLSELERAQVIERAEHVREVLTGFRSGSRELPRPEEPRPEYAPETPFEARYAAKAAELGVTGRTVRRWVAAYHRNGEAGLAPRTPLTTSVAQRVDERWLETALEVMVEHAGQSKPSRKMVIDRTRARVIARYGPDVVRLPSQATAYRALGELERRHPLFRLSTKRNRDIAERPEGPYGKLRPTRPGEYLLMDTTRLDVFAFDPLTLRWVQAEAFFLDELEAIIREWVAVVYHCRPHSGLVDPGLPGLRMSPAQMFEHGMARAGCIEVPRDADLGFEFLPTVWRTIQHYGGGDRPPPLQRSRPARPRYRKPVSGAGEERLAVPGGSGRRVPCLLPRPGGAAVAHAGVGARAVRADAAERGRAGLRPEAGGHEVPLPRRPARRR
ncbi:hypothetical protein [Streptomyces roseifaciens]|uniref:hypothetical protein n=1 Tax=Streptomyces roseifaciens TaxID=1488406 RepID=UPI000AE280AD|nr:hypothetical protein [Streptomyces roseifaciens]